MPSSSTYPSATWPRLPQFAIDSPPEPSDSEVAL